MESDKSPSPDRMTSLFFKRLWSIIGKNITLAIQSFFSLWFMLHSLNETLISLISEIHNSSTLSQFRPISLCNVLYKEISKILVARLKPTLSHCINDNQATFIHGRQILDNVIIAHEFLHFFKNKSIGKEGYIL